MPERFDHVVVGAGSAGAALAARLSEDPARRVLLLEAGGPDTKAEIEVPFLHTRLLKSDVDWFHYTEPEAQLGHRRIYWPRGKVLGGCSSCNFMIVLRGHAADYERWAALGNAGWDFASVLPVFRRMENFHAGASTYHGVGGPVDVARLRCVNPLTHAFVQAAVDQGVPRSNDHNGAAFEGVDYVQVSQRDGRRSSVVRGYLDPARARANLTVTPRAHATRIVVQNRRAVAVEYRVGNEARIAQADGDIVLSAGAIGSPHLLLLSGIGPADALRAAGVAVVHDLPGVGQGLRDHFIVPVNYHCRKPVSLANAELAENQDVYMSSRDGPLTSTLVEATSALRVDAASPSPDLAINFIPHYFVDYGFRTYDGHAFTLTVNLRQARSTGSITLQAADPLAAPRMSANYLADESEWRTVLRGIEMAREIAHGAALAEFRGSELGPGRLATTREALAAYVRDVGQTEFHPVGTCRMGADPLAVVDAQLRVHGIERLRVADASVMPADLSSPTNIATIMIGERAADFLMRPLPAGTPREVAMAQ